ncbi:helix-turn-helix domain-containing protein [Lentzea sp. NPDC102401]|uniref:helix-turn-helix domain-containing protein n=1 Tax=Lentzea sp. NPDC102401 TaxID=3364128 RepID=UPI00380AF37F
MPKNFKSNLQNRAVGRALARWRADSGMSLTEVTKHVGWSTAKTSMLQNALQPIPDHDVLALALIYGIADDRRRPVLLGAQRAQAPTQFELLGGDISACLGWTYAEIESEANYTRVVALEVLPPVVRSPEYEAALCRTQADALSKQLHRHYSDADRKQVIDHLRNGPTLCMDLIIGESILHRPVGGSLVMADQLLRLATFSTLPGVRVQLAPDNNGALAGMAPFTAMSFREVAFDDVVYLDTLHGGTWLESQSDVQPYTETFAQLASEALPTNDTSDRLIEAAQQHKDAD